MVIFRTTPIIPSAGVLHRENGWSINALDMGKTSSVIFVAFARNKVISKYFLCWAAPKLVSSAHLNHFLSLSGVNLLHLLYSQPFV